MCSVVAIMYASTVKFLNYFDNSYSIQSNMLELDANTPIHLSAQAFHSHITAQTKINGSRHHKFIMRSLILDNRSVFSNSKLLI